MFLNQSCYWYVMNGLERGPHLCLRPIFVILAVKYDSFEQI